jgi:putative iron-regulated protein
LLAAKVAYKAIRAPYQQSEIMRFDSIITVGANLDTDGGPASVDEWEGQVNAWPLDENHIITIIAGS